ncbi:hypothetical protein CF327_g5985 [Tilletia walkeri]|nr:hypothetical protein CF327_g5985 [Tilletia walkeri]
MTAASTAAARTVAVAAAATGGVAASSRTVPPIFLRQSHSFAQASSSSRPAHDPLALTRQQRTTTTRPILLSASPSQPSLAHASSSSSSSSTVQHHSPQHSQQQHPRQHRTTSAGFIPSTRTLTPIPDLPSLRSWFASNFPFLALPDNVLLQLITHESHNMGRRAAYALEGTSSSADILSAGAHNRRLSFLGRRALHAFLALFLHGLSASTSIAEEARRAADELLRSPDALDVILHTGRLGDRPGRALQLEQVMRWTPAHLETERGAHERGLYTVRGRALEAFIGAIYHQHGANHASQTFHAHILPHIDAFPPDTPRALWDAIKARAEHDQRSLAAFQDWAGQKRVDLGYRPVAVKGPVEI